MESCLGNFITTVVKYENRCVLPSHVSTNQQFSNIMISNHGIVTLATKGMIA